MIDRFTVDKILDAANIVDVVSEFVTLRKSGANYKGLCPFHNERTPSFYVPLLWGVRLCRRDTRKNSCCRRVCAMRASGATQGLAETRKTA